jgi:hypothetical protein
LGGGLKCDIIRKKAPKEALLVLPEESIMIQLLSTRAGYTKDYQKKRDANM